MFYILLIAVAVQFKVRDEKKGEGGMTTYFQIPNYGTSARVYERNIEQKHAGKMGRGCKDVKVGIGARGKEERTVAALAISKTNKDTINTAKKMGYVKLASYIAGPENNNLYVRPKDVARTFSDVIEKKSEKKLSDLNELISLTRKPPKIEKDSKERSACHPNDK